MLVMLRLHNLRFMLIVIVVWYGHGSDASDERDYIDYFDMEIEDDVSDTFVSLQVAKLKSCVERSSNTEVRVCCEGYVENPQNTSTCVPVCENGCPKGVCFKPNHCLCFSGYVRSNNGDCVETCPKSCLNGRCKNDTDGVCVCDTGYVLDKSGKFCTPYCEPECHSNRNCTAPGLCRCKKHYTLNTHPNGRTYCDPICKKHCWNGVCASPDVCVCSRGFRLIDGVCQANCWQNCRNGVCTEENVCQCNKGYKLSLRTLTCEKMCTGCDNGYCVDSHTCVCNEGYQHKDSTCTPRCKKGCGDNQVCIAPEVCACKEGFKKNKLTGECKKAMHIKKVVQTQDYIEHIAQQTPAFLFEMPEFVGHTESNTKCIYKIRGVSAPVENSLVTYSEGNFSFYEACCKGYKRNKDNPDSCDPICSNCDNGWCIAPETCECNAESVKDLGGNCVRTCPHSCLNGHCDPLNRCHCKEGYKLDKSGKFCAPECKVPCKIGGNGTLDKTEKFCVMPCGINANCSAPNTCTCMPGYRVEGATPCSPICDPPCINAVCSAPNQCTCYSGYSRKNEHICEAFCARKCLNGYCESTNRCACDFGWELDEDAAECKPVCSPSCENGYCRAPNDCVCYKNYKKIHGKCVPDCPQGCIGGVCVAPGECRCPHGYALNSDGICALPIRRPMYEHRRTTRRPRWQL